MIEFDDHSFIRNTYSATGEKLSTSYGISLGPVLSPFSGGNAVGDAPLGGLVISGDGGIPADDSGNPEPQAGQFRYYCDDVVYDMAPPFYQLKKRSATCGASEVISDLHACRRDMLWVKILPS